MNVMDIPLLDKAFNRIGVITDAPENHGVLCGLLCARGEIARDAWLALMIDQASVPMAHDLQEEESSELTRLYSETVRELQDPDTLITPLLPDDDAPLDVRAEAVAAWCRGFIYGLGAGGIEDIAVLPDEVREFVGDMIEISQASSETDHGDEDESAYLELIEYLRAGMTLVYETLEAERGNTTGQRTLH